MAIEIKHELLCLCKEYRKGECDFSEVVASAMSVLDLDPYDWSWDIDIPVPTIIRWSEGKSEPRSLVADFVVEDIETKATEIL